MMLKGVIDQALSFNGADEYITFTQDTVLQNLQELTYSLWVKWNGKNSGYQGIIEIRDIGYLRMGFNDSSLNFGATAWDTNVGSWGKNVPEGIWTHIAVTYSYNDPVGTDPKFYVNGVLQVGLNEFPTPAGIFTPTIETQGIIGASFVSGIRREFNGEIDDARIYNRVLSDAEITELYNKANENLVGHWKLDETSGTTAVDSSQYGNDGSMNGGLDASNDNTNGVIDNALNFDGVSDYIDLGDPSLSLENGNTERTYSLWFKTDQNGTRILTHSEGGFTTSGIGISDDNKIRAFYNNSSDIFAKIDTSSSSFLDNKWHYIAAVYNGSNLDLYIDGNLEAQATNVGLPTYEVNSSDNYEIGAHTASSTDNYYGDLDDIRVYNRALTVAEIQEIYNKANGALVAHYKLDETSGTTAVDSSNNSNDGTMGGGLDAGNDNVEGIVDTALDFDGSDDRISLNAHEENFDFSDENQFTISAWARPVSGDPNTTTIFARGATNSSAGNTVYSLEGGVNNDWNFNISDGSTEYTIDTTNGTFDYGEWQHVAGVWDGETQYIYLNGVLDKSSSRSGFNLWNGNEALDRETAVGRDERGNRYYFNGDLDDVRVYNQALSAAEIKELVSNSLGGLVAHYRLDETTGTTAEDSSIYGND